MAGVSQEMKAAAGIKALWSLRGQANPVGSALDGDLHPWPGLPLEETWTLVKVGTAVPALPRSGRRRLGKAISGAIRWEGIF